MDANFICSSKKLNEYFKERIIGSGTFGKVYLIKVKGSPYALKEINMNALTPVEKQRAFNEVSLLAKLSHRFIIKYRDSSLDYTIGKLLIVMDYAEGGDLSSAIKKQKGVPFYESRVLIWFSQICLALQYIHSQNILHRDLKTQNIFLCKTNSIKVGDFGIARVLGNSQDFASTAIGTPYYFSPEICLKKPYNSKSDMWALGCLLYEMSALTNPFKADNYPTLVSVILERNLKPYPSWCSNLIKQLVENLVCLDPDMRPSTEEILAYPSLQPFLMPYIQSPTSISPTLRRKNYRIPEDSCKRIAPSAVAASSNCSKIFKLSPRTENEQKGQSLLTRVSPPAILVTKYKTPDKVTLNEKRSRSASTRATPSIITPPATNTKTEERLMEKLRKSRQTGAFNVTDYKTQNKLIEKVQKVCSASTLVSPPAIVVTEWGTENKFSKNEAFLSSASSLRRKDKVAKKIPTSDIVVQKRRNNITYTVTKEENNCKTPSEIPSTLTPNDIDCGYSSTEITGSADSSDNICEHSKTNGENDFSLIKYKDNEKMSNDQSHCQHSQCHQCMIDMMWKNRIRGCINVSKNNSDYLKLKSKLLLTFEPNLFKKVYESLLNEWEGNESQESIKNYVKILNYEQVQHLPLMMQLIQLDVMKSARDRANSQSDELVKL